MHVRSEIKVKCILVVWFVMYGVEMQQKREPLN